jgi:hypothetical protein
MALLAKIRIASDALCAPTARFNRMYSSEIVPSIATAAGILAASAVGPNNFMLVAWHQ